MALTNRRLARIRARRARQFAAEGLDLCERMEAEIDAAEAAMRATSRTPTPGACLGLHHGLDGSERVSRR